MVGFFRLRKGFFRLRTIRGCEGRRAGVRQSNVRKRIGRKAMDSVHRVRVWPRIKIPFWGWNLSITLYIQVHAQKHGGDKLELRSQDGEEVLGELS